MFSVFTATAKHVEHNALPLTFQRFKIISHNAFDHGNALPSVTHPTLKTIYKAQENNKYNSRAQLNLMQCIAIGFFLFVIDVVVVIVIDSVMIVVILIVMIIIILAHVFEYFHQILAVITVAKPRVDGLGLFVLLR